MYDDLTIADLKSHLATANKQILEYEQTEASVCPEDVGIIEYVSSLQKKLADSQDEVKRLREFVRFVIRQECWSIFEQDGGDIQELAEKLGLIVPHAATEQDVGDESDYGVGDTIFKFSDMLKENT